MGFERSRINVDARIGNRNDRVVRQFQTSRVDDDLKRIGNRAVPVRVVVGAGQRLFVPDFAAQETVKISILLRLDRFHPNSACLHAVQTISSPYWVSSASESLTPTPSRDSRCTFRFRGSAQD